MVTRQLLRAICVQRNVIIPRLASSCSSNVAKTQLLQVDYSTSYRRFSDSGSSEKTEQNKQSSQDKAKVKRAYALGGCLLFIWLSTHGILLYRRRSEYRKLNEKIPPISWEQFCDEYLSKGLVNAIVFQPHFRVGNVYLVNSGQKEMKKAVLEMFHAAPDKFSRPPDVRFGFEGDEKQLENFILAIQKDASKAGVELAGVDFSLDQFPSYRELSFIIGSTLFTLAAMTLIK